MVARVTLAEIDAVRTSVEQAVQLFEDAVLPVLREQPGYRGVHVLATPEGKALVMSLWEDEEAAAAGLASGYYIAQLERFVTFFRSAPGREAYQVVLSDEPTAAIR